MGNGLNIRLGVDPIAGLNAPYVLPAELIEYVVEFGMTQLAQVQNLDSGPHNGNYWYSTSDLNLGGVWSEIWTTYIKGLSHGGIRISNAEDALI